MTIDFHSHILPSLDDGSASIEESLMLLDMLAENGTDIVAATPHFYCHEISLDSFLEARNAAYERLKPYLKPKHPKILLGAEVLFSSKLRSLNGLERLAIEGTNYLLLEMPYIRLSPQIINSVSELADSGIVKILMAHIERYLNFTDFSDLESLMSLDILGQLNANSFLNRKTRKRCFKLMNKGYVQVIGSDLHHKDRGAAVSKAYEVIEKKYGQNKISQIEESGKRLLNDMETYEVIG